MIWRFFLVLAFSLFSAVADEPFFVRFIDPVTLAPIVKTPVVLTPRVNILSAPADSAEVDPNSAFAKSLRTDSEGWLKLSPSLLAELSRSGSVYIDSSVEGYGRFVLLFNPALAGANSTPLVLSTFGLADGRVQSQLYCYPGARRVVMLERLPRAQADD